jgi:hypothetical protein
MRPALHAALLTVAAFAVGPAPALAAGKTDRLAACMWEKSPTSTARFVDNSDRSKEFSFFMKASAACGSSLPGRIDFKGLRKKLTATRPSVIGPDLETDGEAFVCPRGPDGYPLGCKPAGE